MLPDALVTYVPDCSRHCRACWLAPGAPLVGMLFGVVGPGDGAWVAEIISRTNVRTRKRSPVS